MQEVRQPGVYLHRNDLVEAFGEQSGEGSSARADLYYNLVGARVSGLHDLPRNRRILEEVLAQGLPGSNAGLSGLFACGRHRH